MIGFGILGAAEIASRMFLPALLNNKECVCVGVASRTQSKREEFRKIFSIDTFDNYSSLIGDSQVQAVYIPLPHSLHYEWAKKALQLGKHVFLEKPATTSLQHTLELIEIARKSALVLQENYMFQYHLQFAEIRAMLESGIIGQPYLYRADFGIPLRKSDDFRYNKELGGGALLDTGGYVLKIASLLLGKTATLKASQLSTPPGYEVDMSGSVTLENEEGIVFQGAFGMDHFYQCTLTIWGRSGKMVTDRIFTAPPGFEPSVVLSTVDGNKTISLTSDNHFAASLSMFIEAMHDDAIRNKMYDDMEIQSRLLQETKR